MKGCYPLTDFEVEQCLLNFSQLRTGTRNKALFMWGILSGFRISEILSLRRKHIISENGIIEKQITIPAVDMKGSKKTRTIVFNKTAQKYLMNWIFEQTQKGFSSKNQHVFSTSLGTPLSRFTVHKILKKCYAQIGLPNKGYATHTLRKTFARSYIDLYRNDEKNKNEMLPELQKALNHASMDTTLLYIAFDDTVVDHRIMQMGEKW